MKAIVLLLAAACGAAPEQTELISKGGDGGTETCGPPSYSCSDPSAACSSIFNGGLEDAGPLVGYGTGLCLPACRVLPNQAAVCPSGTVCTTGDFMASGAGEPGPIGVCVSSGELIGTACGPKASCGPGAWCSPVSQLDLQGTCMDGGQ